MGDCSQLLLIDPGKKTLKTKVAHKMPLREFRVDENLRGCAIGHVCLSGELVNVPDFQRSRFFTPEDHLNYIGGGQELRTSICVPLVNTDYVVIGCLEVCNKKNNRMFSTEDIERLTNIASHVALTLEGEGSSIRKILAMNDDQRRVMKQSLDFVKTKTLQSGPIVPDVTEDGVEDEWDDLEVEADHDHDHTGVGGDSTPHQVRKHTTESNT